MDLPSTERLTLRRYAPDDFDAFAALYGDPDVARWVGGVLDRDKSREMFDTRVLGYYAKHPGLGVWATHDRATGAHVGSAVLNHIQGEELIQVGYVLGKDWWGRGLATELAVALLHHAYVGLRLPSMCAITNRDNTPSQHVLLKAGLHRRGERSFAHPAYADGNPLTFFDRTATEWLEERRARA